MKMNKCIRCGYEQTPGCLGCAKCGAPVLLEGKEMRE